MNPAIGVIVMFASNYAPIGWALCNGQILQISQNAALFSILGTTYGGNGSTNFALPDLRGRTPIGSGQGAGLTNRTLGQSFGTTSYTLAASDMPAHSHTGSINIPVSSSAANLDEPGGNILAAGGPSHFAPSTNVGPNMPGLSTVTSANNGGGQPFSKRQPYLAINFVIALVGIFPSRN